MGHVNVQEMELEEHIQKGNKVARRLWDSGLIEAVSFPISILSEELVVNCVNHYNLETREIGSLSAQVLCKLRGGSFAFFYFI